MLGSHRPRHACANHKNFTAEILTDGSPNRLPGFSNPRRRPATQIVLLGTVWIEHHLACNGT